MAANLSLSFAAPLEDDDSNKKYAYEFKFKPSIWSTEINSKRYGRYLWISKIEMLLEKTPKDDMLCFEQLGIDKIFVDESQA